MEGFKKGFDLGFRGKIKGVTRTAPNLKIRVGSSVILWNKVMKEVEADRYAGPFKDPPFKEFIQSLIGLVPKDRGHDTRLIFHLSFPCTGDSVNSGMPEDFCSVKYPDFSEAVKRCIEEGKFCFIAKSDMKRAFRNLGILPSQWCLLVMRATSPLDNKVYWFFDKCLPFGASISCAVFQAFSDCIAHIVKFKTNKIPINFLDDFFFVAKLRTMCNKQVEIFLDICQEIRFPVSLEKTYWATTFLGFLGLIIDMVNQFVAIPVDKVERARNLIENFLTRKSKKVTLKELQQLAGFLNFLCKCIVPGRTFLRRLYDHFMTNLMAHHHIRIDQDIRRDLSMWQQFLEEPTIYCRPFLDFNSFLTAEHLDWYTDISGVIGCGGICRHEWFQLQWSDQFLALKPSIEFQELYAVTVSILLWLKNYQNKRICIFCDNRSVVDILEDMSSKCKDLMVLVRIIVRECMTWNVRLFAEHVKTNDNFLADAISRFEMDRFYRDARKLGRKYKVFPCTIPTRLWPPKAVWCEQNQ